MAHSPKELRKFIEFCSTVTTNKTTEQLDALPKDEHGFIDFSKLYQRHKMSLMMKEFSNIIVTNSQCNKKKDEFFKAIDDVQDDEAGEDLLRKLRNCEL